MLLALDRHLNKVGCPLLQAEFTGDDRVAHRFITDSWLLAPTKQMNVYDVSDNELAGLVELLNNRLKTVGIA